MRDSVNQRIGRSIVGGRARPGLTSVLLHIGLLMGFCGLYPTPVLGQTVEPLTVTTLDDNVTTPPPGSLRQAIQTVVNASINDPSCAGKTFSIGFAPTLSGPINLGGNALPEIPCNGTVINGGGRIELVGNGDTQNNGLTFAAGTSDHVVIGMTIRNFGGAGIAAASTTRVRIGGPNSGDGNVLQGNLGCGVLANGIDGTEGVEVLGNRMFGNNGNGICRSFLAPFVAQGIESVTFRASGAEVVWRGDYIPPAAPPLISARAELFSNSFGAEGENIIGTCSPADPYLLGVRETLRCVFQSAFLPRTTRNITSTLTLIGNTVTGPDTSQISGAFENATDISALRLSFGQLAPGVRSTKSVTISRPQFAGGVELAVSLQSPGFSLLTGLPGDCGPVLADQSSEIAPPNTCTIRVQFAPTVPGQFPGTLAVVANPTGLDFPQPTTFEVSLAGSGTAQALSASLAWSANPVPRDSPTSLRVTLANPNSIDVTGAAGTFTLPRPVAATGAPSLSGAGCSGGTLLAAPGSATATLIGLTIRAGGAPCVLAVPVDTSVTGNFPLSFGTPNVIVGVINGLDVGTPAVAGSALEVGGSPLQFTPSPLSFPTPLGPGATSLPVTLTLANTSAASVTLASPVFNTPENFQVVGSTCVAGASLAAATQPGASCVVQVAFAPRRAGQIVEALTASAVDIPPATVTLSGTGAPPAPIGVQLLAAGASSASASPGSPIPVTLAIRNANAAPFIADPSRFTLALPSGLTVGDPAAVGLTAGCGAASASASALFIDGLQVPTGGECVLRATVVGQLPTGSASTTVSLVVDAGAVIGRVLSASASNTAPSAVTLTINRAQQPLLVVDPAGPVSFGLVGVGIESRPPRVFTIRSEGQQALVLEAITVSREFRIVATTCRLGMDFPLAPGATCQVDVVVRPTAEGPIEGSLGVASNGGAVSVLLRAQGTFVPVPGISLSRAALSFGAQRVSTVSEPASVTVFSTGTAPLEITQVTTSGDFIVDSNCTAAPIAPGGACAISVAFAPIVLGPRVGEIVLATNDPDSPAPVIALGGEGASAAVPIASVSSSIIEFPDTPVGSTSESRSATLTNSGLAPLEISTVTVSATGFRLTNGCPSILLPAASCTLSLVFIPTSEAAFSATLRIETNAPGSPASVLLLGNGTRGPRARLEADPASLAFPDQVLGTVSAARAVVVRNTGAAPAVAPLVSITEGYTLVGACGRIEPGGSCSLGVAFAPTALGDRPGSLTIRSDPDGTSTSVSLTGRGVPAPAPRLSLSATTLAFGNSLLGIATHSSIAVTNTGNASLVFGPISATGDFLVTGNCAGVLGPGGTCSLRVTFRPLLPGGRSGAITISANDPAGPGRVALSGTGCRFALTGRSFALVCSP